MRSPFELESFFPRAVPQNARTELRSSLDHNTSLIRVTTLLKIDVHSDDNIAYRFVARPLSLLTLYKLAYGPAMPDN